MEQPTKSTTEIQTQSTQPSTSAIINAAMNKGNTNKSQNQVENQKEANPPTITIDMQEYNRLLYYSKLVQEVSTRIDAIVHNQKGVVTNALNQQVRNHNILADMEALKDALSNEARF